MGQTSRRIDDLFPEYNIKLRNWILESIKEDLTLFNYLISSPKENESMLGDKPIAESVANLRGFIKTLWPKKKRRGRMIETDMDWKATD